MPDMESNFISEQPSAIRHIAVVVLYACPLFYRLADTVRHQKFIPPPGYICRHLTVSTILHRVAMNWPASGSFIGRVPRESSSGANFRTCTCAHYSWYRF